MPIVFNHLRAFHEVAERGGFTAASKFLGIGQPTLTTQVKQLENMYGVELFIRKGKTIELTETGNALLEITRGISKFRDEAHDLLSAHGKNESGHLRLATVGPFHATEILATFKREHPKIKIATLLGNSPCALKHVLDFEAEVAILAHVPEDLRVEMVPYRNHSVVVFVNGSHPWFARKSVKLGELVHQPFVLRERGSTTRRAFEQALHERGLSIEPIFEIESREGVWKAVERGLGISVVADFEFVPHPNLRALKISDCEIQTEYSVAYRKDRAHSPIIQAFMKTVSRMANCPLAGTLSDGGRANSELRIVSLQARRS
jgi:aminoethylphosphonate catabolism LysR family transcriptional regulator